MVTSPYEWKILEWDDQPHKNKQTSNQKYSILFLFEAVHMISLFLTVFDPKLDHPDAGVINWIINIVHFNPRDRKHIHLHQ